MILLYPIYCVFGCVGSFCGKLKEFHLEPSRTLILNFKTGHKLKVHHIFVALLQALVSDVRPTLTLGLGMT